MSSILRNAAFARICVLALGLSAVAVVSAQAAEQASNMTSETSMNEVEQSYDNGVATYIP